MNNTDKSWEWYKNNINKGYFFQEKFWYIVGRWVEQNNLKTATSNVSLEQIIYDISAITAGDDLYPKFEDTEKVAQWEIDQKYGDADKELFTGFYKVFRDELIAGPNIESGNIPNDVKANLANKKWASFSDWEISRACGNEALKALFTGVELKNLPEDSACRVSPEPNKTRIDAFLEGVSGGPKILLKGALENGKQLFNTVWETSPFLIIGLVFITGAIVFIEVKAKKS